MHSHEEWFLKAKNDLRASKKLMTGENIILDSAVYHTQQCAEKALKSFLAYKQKPLEKTHDLEKLISLCSNIDYDFENLLHEAITLNPYCFKFRYPDDCLLPDKKDVIQAIEYAEKILNFVNTKIFSHTKS